MAGMTETGATDIKKSKPHRYADGNVYYEMDADIRLGLLLLAEHVYCVDGKKTGFTDIPGFRLLGQSEMMALLGIGNNEVSQLSTGVPGQDSRDTVNYKRLFPEQVKSKPGDDVKDVEYQMSGSLYEEFDKLYGITHGTPHRNRSPLKGEKIIFCGEKKIVDKKTGKSVSVGGGILSNDGFLTDCGFKAAIYEITDRKYSFHDVECYKPPFEGKSLINARYVLAFSGTDITSGFADWLKTNIGQALPYSFMYPMQYKLAVNLGLLLRQSIEKYGQSCSDWVITGHSLGGGLASAASAVSGVNAVTFNAAGLNRAALAAYIHDMYDKENKGIWGKSFDFAKTFFSLGMLTKDNSLYERAINSDAAKNRVAAYRGTTDVLTSTEDNIHGSKTNVFEYIGMGGSGDSGLQPSSQMSTLQQEIKEVESKGGTIINDVKQYKDSLLDLPRQLPKDISDLGTGVKDLAGQMALSGAAMLSDTKLLIGEFGKLFTGSDSLKKKFSNIADLAKQIAGDAKDIYESSAAVVQQAKDIKDKIIDVWAKPVELYLEALDMWEDVKKLTTDYVAFLKNPVKCFDSDVKTSSDVEWRKGLFLSRLMENVPDNGLLASVASSANHVNEGKAVYDKYSNLDYKNILLQGAVLFESSGDLFSEIKECVRDLKYAFVKPKEFYKSVSRTVKKTKETIDSAKKIYKTIHEAYTDLRSAYDLATALFLDMKSVCNETMAFFSDPQARFVLAKNTLNTALKVFPVYQTVIPKPVTAAMSIVAKSVGEWPPRVFGRRIDVNTEYYKEYASTSGEKYLAYADDPTGHGLWMLLDGFVYGIYDTNNHFITCQQGKASDSDIFDNVIARHWRWQNTDDRKVKIYHRRDLARIGGEDTEVSVYPNILEIKNYVQPPKDVEVVEGKCRKKTLLMSERCSNRCKDGVGSQVYVGKQVNEERYEVDYKPVKRYNDQNADDYLLSLIKTTGVDTKKQQKMYEKYRMSK